MEVGFSLFLGNGGEANARVLERARRSGLRRAFTSFQIPEDSGRGCGELRSRAMDLLGSCRDAGIGLMVDVSPTTLEMLGLSALEELSELGVSCVRLDYGFPDERVVGLSRTFKIAFNASTTPLSAVRSWEHAGADPSRFLACHNYYPKPLTGMSFAYVREVDERFRFWGIETVAFVPGDGGASGADHGLRGPLHEGLPTVEEQRAHRDDLVRNVLELRSRSAVDCVLVGDPDMSERSWKALGDLADGYVTVRVGADEAFRFLDGTVHRDRIDSSPLLLRSVNSRSDADVSGRLRDAASRASERLRGLPRPAGSVCVSSADYGRYGGELEIMRVDAPGDPRVLVVGRVCRQDRGLLSMLDHGLAVRLEVEAV